MSILPTSIHVLQASTCCQQAIMCCQQPSMCCSHWLYCRYDIKCKMIDQAVSMDKNAGFTHWRSRIVNKVCGGCAQSMGGSGRERASLGSVNGQQCRLYSPALMHREQRKWRHTREGDEGKDRVLAVCMDQQRRLHSLALTHCQQGWSKGRGSGAVRLGGGGSMTGKDACVVTSRTSVLSGICTKLSMCRVVLCCAVLCAAGEQGCF